MQTGRLLLSKLRKRRVWRRVLLERASEPLHLNLASLAVLAFGSYRAKVDWDLVVRPHYAYGILKAADIARAHGIRHVTLVEFGVASGGGLLNMATIASRVTAVTGVDFTLHGFDSGTGMPPARDYRDHPDLYQQGDFTMDEQALRAALPSNVHLHLGPLTETVPRFADHLDPAAPLGFVALDVDYYSSTVEALEALRGAAEGYLPLVVVYADDVTLDEHNSACGELLAIAEFNAANPLRRLEQNPFLEHSRVFRRPAWLRQIYFFHLLDHPVRSAVRTTTTKRYLENPYLKGEQGKELFVLPAEEGAVPPAP